MIEKSKTTRDEKETFVVIPTNLTKTFLFNTLPLAKLDKYGCNRNSVTIISAYFSK